MERLKRVIRQALSEKAHRIKLQVGTEFEILAQQGIRMMPDGPLVDEVYLNLLFSALFPKDQQEAIARKIITQGTLTIANVGTVHLIASPLPPISLRLYLPPRGQEMFNADWDRLQIRQSSPSEPKIPLDRSYVPDSMFAPSPPVNPIQMPDARSKAPSARGGSGDMAGGILGHHQAPGYSSTDFLSSSPQTSDASDLPPVEQPTHTLSEPEAPDEMPNTLDMFSPKVLQAKNTRAPSKIPLPESIPSPEKINIMGNFGAELLKPAESLPKTPSLDSPVADSSSAFAMESPTFGSPASVAQSPLHPDSGDFKISTEDYSQSFQETDFEPKSHPSTTSGKQPPYSQVESAHYWEGSPPAPQQFKEPEAPLTISFGPDDDGASGDYREDKPIDQILRKMIEKRASDLHLTCNQPVCFRIDGDIQRIDQTPVDPVQMEQLINPILPNKNLTEFVKINDTDFAYELPGVGRFRVNIFRDKNGVGTVIRHIPSKILTAEQLQLPPVINKFCQLTKGLVVVTGPTGSGKSTTLAAMLDWINKNRAEHILTIEDPVEFVHPQQRCLVNQREVHRHTSSFARALKAALREDPDIILIGEMRDLETIAIAIETAETGHLVFGTLHTTTAVSTVDRIIDQFPADRQAQIRTMLASSLKGVVAQTLLKKKGGGRVAAHEILVLNDAVSAMIREGKIHMVANHMQTQKAEGNVLLNESLFKLIKENLVDPEEAVRKSVDKASLLDLLRRNNLFSQPPSGHSPSASVKPGSNGQKSA